MFPNTYLQSYLLLASIRTRNHLHRQRHANPDIDSLLLPPGIPLRRSPGARTDHIRNIGCCHRRRDFGRGGARLTVHASLVLLELVEG